MKYMEILIIIITTIACTLGMIFSIWSLIDTKNKYYVEPNTFFSSNITISELEDALKFAKSLNKNTITIHFDKSNGISRGISVSESFDSKQIDITDYKSW